MRAMGNSRLWHPPYALLVCLSGTPSSHSTQKSAPLRDYSIGSRGNTRFLSSSASATEPSHSISEPTIWMDWQMRRSCVVFYKQCAENKFRSDRFRQQKP